MCISVKNRKQTVNSMCICQAWHYVESFSGPAPRVLAVATPALSLQSGSGAPCYAVAAYSDGSLQCLLRDSLQQVGSTEIPKLLLRTSDQAETGGGSPAKKRPRPSSAAASPIRSLSFTATGNALVAVDATGQIYAYCVSPISDPGGSHTPAFLSTMLEYCLVSGIDSWDVTACARAGHIEAVCERLEENFAKQSTNVKEYYDTR